MKKIIIACLIALTYTSANAQEPTKQETMDWIASKIKAYPGRGSWKEGAETEYPTTVNVSYILKKK